MLVLLSVYLLLYNGVRVSNDEIYLFDSAESVARRADFERNFTFHLLPEVFTDGTPSLGSLYEPLHPLFSAPLIWMAQALPQVGIMQAAWMFNIVAVIATAAVLYAYGILTGYRTATAWIVALVFGLGTGALPYAMTYFREPLTGLFTLLVVIAALHYEQDRRLLFLLLGALIGVALTKVVGLVIVLIPLILLMRGEWRSRRLAIGGVLGLVVVGALLSLLVFAPTRLGLDTALNRMRSTDVQDILNSVIGYQISPSRSIWLFSPVLIVALLGFWRRQRRLFIALIITLVVTTVVLALVHRELWWGGNGWGPRYFVSFLPVIALGLLPVVESLRGGWRVAFFGLVMVSIGIQVLGTSVFVTDYYAALSEANIVPWEAGLWQWEWSQIPRTFALIDLDQLNIAFIQADSALASLLITAVLGALGGLCIALWRTEYTRFTVPLVALTAVVIPMAVGAKLVSVYDDPRYGEGDVVALVDSLDEQANTDEVVLVQDSAMSLTFMNRFKTPAHIFVLPDAPGEVHNPDVLPRVDSDQIAENAGLETALLISKLSQDHDTLWLVMPYGPFITFTRRPTERYMSLLYFPVSEIEISQRARAIAYSTYDPDRSVTHNEVEYIFGDVLTLTDVYLVEGERYQRGEVVPLSLLWAVTDDPPVRDYTVSVHISPPETNVPVVQRDTLPQGKFGYTSRWQPDESYIDQHGMALPASMPPGEYCVNVILYYWEDGARLEAVNRTGESLGDVVCVARIEVTA